ncbi:MAG: hypothetical protein AAF639_13255 [Chloroflexota bacterium]
MTETYPTQPDNPASAISASNVSHSQNVAVGTNIYMNAQPPTIDPADKQNQKNHAVLRQAVNRFWVHGVLKHSLYNEARIRLGLSQRTDAVNQPWDLILQRPDEADRLINENSELIDIYDEMGGQMLILGSPGSGKTTTLLMLAESLLTRAEQNPEYPTPVVFNLSSWREWYAR